MTKKTRRVLEAITYITKLQFSCDVISRRDIEAMFDSVDFSDPVTAVATVESDAVACTVHFHLQTGGAQFSRSLYAVTRIESEVN